jgi:histidinol-phosphate aminotransferase
LSTRSHHMDVAHGVAGERANGVAGRVEQGSARGDGQAVAHGGPDDGPPIVWDFSSNANAVPLPAAFHARLLDADRTRYPDPAYAGLRRHLAEVTRCRPEHILPTSGSSEGIRRLTLAASLQGVREVWVPLHAYADHAAAALALGLPVRHFDPDESSAGTLLEAACANQAVLLWLCEPCNPTGMSLPTALSSALMAWAARPRSRLVIAIDRAYAPLRLDGQDAIDADPAAALCWQCWSPNKALNLTGVRAGWIQAPAADPLGLTAALRQLAPSWVLSAEGVSMLTHWLDPDIQHWLGVARRTLSDWLAMQQGALIEQGWSVWPTQVPFFLARPPPGDVSDLPALLAGLRQQGIKLRDAASFGLPGLVRLRVHAPQAQRALLEALSAWRRAGLPPEPVCQIGALPSRGHTVNQTLQTDNTR